MRSWRDYAARISLTGAERAASPRRRSLDQSAGQELADGLVRQAEEKADVTLGQALIPEAPSGHPRLVRGVGAHFLGLLPGAPGPAHFLGERGVKDGHDLHRPDLVCADIEMQRQQVTRHGLGLIQAPRLGVGRIAETVTRDLKRPPAPAAASRHLKVPASHQRSSSAASAHIRSKTLRIPRAVYSTISL